MIMFGFDQSQPLVAVKLSTGLPCSPTTQGWPGKQYLLSGISVALVPHTYFTKNKHPAIPVTWKKTPKSAMCSYFLQFYCHLKKMSEFWNAIFEDPHFSPSPQCWAIQAWSEGPFSVGAGRFFWRHGWWPLVFGKSCRNWNLFVSDILYIYPNLGKNGVFFVGKVYV